MPPIDPAPYVSALPDLITQNDTMKSSFMPAPSPHHGGNNPLSIFWSVFNGPALQNASHEADINSMLTMARENERKMIGQELHDNVNQILSTVKLFIEMLQPADRREERIQRKTIEYVLLAIDEIRVISKELVAPQHCKRGLVDNICKIIDDIHFSTTIKIAFNHSRNVERLAADKKTNLLRIVQEQLKNVIKHSNATQVNIDLRVHSGLVTLVIKDNGIGFDPQQTSNGIGFTNIHDRVSLHKGVVKLQSSPGGGCTLEVSLPAQ